MDHVVQIPTVGREWEDMPDSTTTLGFLAASTTTVRLGALVHGITYRNIAQLAKITATLDVLSGGRAFCGLGTAWFGREHELYGWDFPPVARRYAMLEDALELLPLMWGKGTPPFAGRTITIPAATCYPRPVQDRVPILVGGSGERRTLRLVARYADACNLFGPPDVVAHKVAVLRAHCADVDRDPATVTVTNLSEAAILGGSASAAERDADVVGTVEEHVGRYRQYAEAGVEEAIVALHLDGTTGPGRGLRSRDRRVPLTPSCPSGPAAIGPAAGRTDRGSAQRAPGVNSTGIVRTPVMKFDASGSGLPAGARSGRRVSSSRSITAISMRATWRPRQRCGPPPPNAMCGFGSRPTSKRSGSVEHVLVAVAGAVEHHQLVAGLDRLVVDDRVLHRRAPEVHDGRRVAQHLLDRRGEQPVDVGLQAGPLVRVVEELLDAGRQQVARRVAAGVDEQQEEPLELGIGQPDAVDLGLDERRGDVVARLGPLARRGLPA